MIVSIVCTERAETAAVSCGTTSSCKYMRDKKVVTYEESNASSLIENREQRYIKAINNKQQCQSSGAV